MKKLTVAGAAVLTMFAGGQARAAVTYTFNAPVNAGYGPLSFNLITDSYIEADTVFGPSDLTSCASGAATFLGESNACLSVAFFTSGASDTTNSFMIQGPNHSRMVSVSGIGVFGHNGDTIVGPVVNGGVGHFTVSGFAETAVPEPATWSMMILGFGAAGSIIRRRRVALTA